MSTSARDVGITCLNCGQGTFTPNRSSLDTWNCGYCHSGFVSLTMLQNIATPEMMEQILHPKERLMDRLRHCPVCPAKLDGIRIYHSGKGVRLDICRSCRLAWFDSGDLLRTLRHRSSDVDPRLDEPAVGVRRKKGSPVAEVVPTIWMTASLMAIMLLLTPFVIHLPQLIDRYAFAPLDPWRDYGLTFLSSLFVHSNVFSALLNIGALWYFGGHCERRLGPDRFCALFVSSAAIGRLVYWATGMSGVLLRDQPLACGAGVATTALGVYWLLTNYRKPAPGEKFMYSGPPILSGLLLLAGLCFYLTFTFLQNAIGNGGGDSLNMESTFVPAFLAWCRSPQAYSYMSAALIGGVWGASDKGVSLVTPRRK